MLPSGSKLPTALITTYVQEWSAEMEQLLFAPADLARGMPLETVTSLFAPYLPDGVLPLAVVDEESIAAVALEPLFAGHPAGCVYRCYVQDGRREQAPALLDNDPLAYVQSVEEELRARPEGLVRMLEIIGPAFEQSYAGSDRRPRDFVVRPIRLACQNVIVGLAAIAQDASFDGLSVVAWQTCEVPHLAAHEANRALAALMLCDAFQNGGTMEIRFDRSARVQGDDWTETLDGHPERRVPASLRRFGRAKGVPLGEDDIAAITPSEARELFVAVTPMPSELRSRVDDAVAHLGMTPESICFALLAQIWREIEVDFMLATSSRASSILVGGSEWQLRGARQAESEVCRAAVMVGMFYRRLNSLDNAAFDGSAGIREVEDRSKGVTWSVDGDAGSVTFSGLWPEPLPWSTDGAPSQDGTLVVYPRSTVTPAVVEQVRCHSGRNAAAVIVPQDAQPITNGECTLLKCPDRIADLDQAVEAKLLRSRISRA